MSNLKFIKIADDGETALYNLYVQGQRVAEALTLDEVLAEISRRDEGGVDE